MRPVIFPQRQTITLQVELCLLCLLPEYLHLNLLINVQLVLNLSCYMCISRSSLRRSKVTLASGKENAITTGGRHTGSTVKAPHSISFNFKATLIYTSRHLSP